MFSSSNKLRIFVRLVFRRLLEPGGERELVFSKSGWKSSVGTTLTGNTVGVKQSGENPRVQIESIFLGTLRNRELLRSVYRLLRRIIRSCTQRTCYAYEEFLVDIQFYSLF